MTNRQDASGTESDIPEVTLVFEDAPTGRGPFSSDGSLNSDTRGRSSAPNRWRDGRSLPESPIPVGVLGVALGITAVIGVVAVNLIPGLGIAGVTTAVALGEAALPIAIARFAAGLGTFGALTVVALVCALISSRRTRPSPIPAFLVTMGTAWMATGLVGTATIGRVPFLVNGIAFLAALAVALGVALPSPVRWPVGALVGVAAVAAAASLVYVGATTIIGALGSVVVGILGVLIGVFMWNRWWAPVMDARDRAQRLMGV